MRMTDHEIVVLFWARDEQAIEETRSKYGSYCRSIALNILADRQDAEECESDTYHTVWNCIPPQRPNQLAPYIGRITRNLSLKRLRQKRAQKRGGGSHDLSLDELLGCIPKGQDFGAILESRELGRIIDRFLRTLPDQQRRIFVCRYWYCDSIEEICNQFGWGQSRVKMALHRTRLKLKLELEKEGVFVAEK